VKLRRRMRRKRKKKKAKQNLREKVKRKRPLLTSRYTVPKSIERPGTLPQKD
jgi:hypothetical protein